MAQTVEALSPSVAPLGFLPRVAVSVAAQRSRPPSRWARWLDPLVWMAGLGGALASLVLAGLGNVLGAEMALPQSALVLAQEPTLAFDSVSGSLSAGLEELGTLVDNLLVSVPDLEIGLLLGACLLLLSSGAVLLRFLNQPQSSALAPRGGGI